MYVIAVQIRRFHEIGDDFLRRGGLGHRYVPRYEEWYLHVNFGGGSLLNKAL